MALQYEFTWLQFVGVVLAGAIFYYSRTLYKNGKFNRRDFWTWGGFSFLLVFGSILPTFIPAILIFTKRALDTLLVLGLLVAFGLIFQVYVRIQQTNKDVTELVRKVAIKFEEYEKRRRNKSK